MLSICSYCYDTITFVILVERCKRVIAQIGHNKAGKNPSKLVVFVFGRGFGGGVTSVNHVGVRFVTAVGCAISSRQTPPLRPQDATE